MNEPVIHKPHTVYTRENWPDEWEEVPYLYCNTLAFAVPPSTQSATLEYSYGRMIRPPGTGDPVNYSPPDLVDKYIKVAVEDGPTWYGICIDSDDQRDAERQNTAVLTGKMVYICRGLEYLLQRDPITKSIVKTDDGEQEIGRAIGFNLGAGLPSSAFREGNAHAAGGAEATYIFTDDLQNGVEWTAANILAYMVAYLFPQTAAGDDNIGWSFDDGIILQYLGPHKPTLQIHGKTAWQVLNELIDRRRLLGWAIVVDPINEVPEIRVFTFTPDNIVLPGEEANTLIANQNQINWSFDSSNFFQACTLATDNTSAFDRVVVRGEPPGSVFTVEMAGGGGNNLLEEDWKSELQDEYDEGATTDPSYPAADNSTGRHNANQTARTADHLKKVYSYFRLNPTTFTGSIGASAVWPIDNENIDVNTSFWLPGIRLQDHLPLRLEHDYETVETITNTMKEKSKWEYQRPFAMIKDDPSGRYFFLDRTGRGENVDTHLEASGRYWAAGLRMQDDAPGIVISVAGAPQHVIAKNTFSGEDADDQADYGGDADYNYLSVTVFAEGDGHVTVTWPEDAMPADQDMIKTLNVFLPNCRLDYLVPNTVIDLEADGTRKLSGGGFIQDDTDYMKDVARSAYDWYKLPRKAMQVTVHSLEYQQANSVTVPNTQEAVGLGSLIRSIGTGGNEQEINSVVTGYSQDLRAGTSTFTTGYAELDFQQ